MYYIDYIYSTIPVVPLRKQVAGNGTRGKDEFGFLQRQDHRLLKEANPKELDFYQHIFNSDDANDKQILPFIR